MPSELAPLVEQDRRDDAIANLGQSLELEPDNMERRSDRAFMLHHKGEHDKAIADFDKILAADPTKVSSPTFEGCRIWPRATTDAPSMTWPRGSS